MKKQQTAPDDRACAEAWESIMATAREHALVTRAYGGVAVLATPESQRVAGVRDRTLLAHCMTEAGS